MAADGQHGAANRLERRVPPAHRRAGGDRVGIRPAASAQASASPRPCPCAGRRSRSARRATASAAGSPPKPSTIHSATLSQRTPRAHRASDRASSGTWPACTARSAGGRRAAANPRQLGREPRRLGAAARVVPGDRGTTGRALVERARRSPPCSRRRSRPRAPMRRPASASRAAAIAATSSVVGIELRAGLDPAPGRRRAAGRHLAAVGVERRGLDRRRASVEAEERSVTTRPSPAAGSGGRQRRASTSPCSSPAPLAYGTSTTDPRANGRLAALGGERAASGDADEHREPRVERAPAREALGAEVRIGVSGSNRWSARSPARRAPSQAVRSRAASARSQPRSRCPSSWLSSNPSHSSSTERSVGSWSSTSRIPAPIACGVPAGTRIASPAPTGISCIAPSIAAESWMRIHSRTSSSSTGRENPTWTAARGSASTMIHASVFP